MKKRTALLSATLCLLAPIAAHADPAVPPESNPFPYPFEARNEMYKEGWIDLNKNGLKDVYEDPDAPMDARIDDLLKQMTVSEKTMQLLTLYGFPHVLKDKHPKESWKTEVWKDGIANIDQHGDAFGNGGGDMNNTPERNAQYINNTQRFFIEQTRLGIPVDFTNEGIRGACVRGGTSLPSPNVQGCLWDVELAEKLGYIMGKESKAVGYTNVYGPILDVSRDQRWGRWEGTIAEDPFIVAEIGKAISAGIQRGGVVNSPKHYVGYGENKAARGWGSRTDPHITAQTFEAIHFYPFMRVFKETSPLGVMCAYNDVNGVPVAASRHLLHDRLRGELGFKGYVVSDSDAVERIYRSHRVANSNKDAHRMRIDAGLNVWTTFVKPNDPSKWINELVAEGKLTEASLNDAVRDVLRVKFILGLFDEPYVRDPKAANAIVGCDEFQEIALQASREALVLLKNDNAALPLKSGLKQVAVIGPNARSNGAPRHYGPSGFKSVTPLDGLKKAFEGSETEVVYTEGCKIVDANWPDSELIPEPMTQQEKDDIAKAVALAEASDVAIVFLGDSPTRTSGESRTRNNLDLPGRQLDLLRAVYATGKPTILVLIHGRPMSINWAQKYIPAIISAGFPGGHGGTAIAEVLTGKYNPGGKLNGTWPKTVGQIPMNFPAKPRSNDEPNVKVTSRAHIPGPLYPFGYGLSYTTFGYSNPKVTAIDGDPAKGFNVSVDITNTGAVVGDEVVQLYISYTQAPVNWFDQMLRGFKRIHLKPGETRTVTMEVPSSHLEIALDTQEWVRPETPFEIRLGTSSVNMKYRFLIQDGKVVKTEEKPANDNHNQSAPNPLTA